MKFSIVPDPKHDSEHAAFMASQRKEILAGKLSVRWSQSACGYRIRSGRTAVPGIESFMTEGMAWEWLEEHHGITKP